MWRCIGLFLPAIPTRAWRPLLFQLSVIHLGWGLIILNMPALLMCALKLSERLLTWTINLYNWRKARNHASTFDLKSGLQKLSSPSTIFSVLRAGRHYRLGVNTGVGYQVGHLKVRLKSNINFQALLPRNDRVDTAFRVIKMQRRLYQACAKNPEAKRPFTFLWTSLHRRRVS